MFYYSYSSIVFIVLDNPDCCTAQYLKNFKNIKTDNYDEDNSKCKHRRIFVQY